jgi:hypothetical protein
MSINLSTKNKRLACVATTRTILNKSGVNPGHGASAMVRIEPSMSVLLHTHLHEQECKYHLHDALGLFLIF